MTPTGPADAPAQAAALEAYARARALSGQTQALAVLHIGARATVIAWGTGPAPQAVSLAMGHERTAREHFRHDLPTPGELEVAIMAVEDELMRVHRQIPQGLPLWSLDAQVRTVADAAGLPPEAVRLTRDTVEHTFNRLVAVSQGRPATQEGLPLQAGFAASLLILRELMHHLGFEAITWAA